MPPSEIHLRPCRPSDFENLLQIDQACFPRGIAYGRNELKLYLRSEGSYCLLAEISGEIVGYILTNRSGDTGHVVTLDVLEPYRRKQVGTALLEAAEQEAASRGARIMVLETATTNKLAIAFWKKHGYREFGVKKDYYGRGLDAYWMRKSVNICEDS